LRLGSVEGVDGFKVSVGAVQLRKLSLDNLSLDCPVFSVAPGAADSKMPAGLLSASALGILGNPFWSHFRLTVDYLNGRIILEQSQASSSTEAILKDLRQILIKYHKDRNAEEAQSNELAKVKAIVTLSRAQIVGEKVSGSKPEEISPAVKAFDAAFATARENNDVVMQSRVLAGEALFLMDHEPGYNEIRNIHRLLQASATLSQSEPDLLVAAAVFCGTEVPAMKRKLIDQALVLDPTNWRALMEKLAIAKRDGKPGESELVIALIRHYYPGCDLTAATSAQPSASTVTPSVKPATKKP
jgi:hypothetical protein